ncbi:MAG: MCE family protein [Legionellales bacterium]|nr:MCE family protein [Legionellales bacterium]
METTAHYTRVGLFVIIFTVALFIGGLWLSVGLSNKTYVTYVTFMHESVSGLSVSAPVKYNGVEIGYVSQIDLYPKNPQNVRLLLSIQEGSPIYNGTTAVLETQGLTGIAYLELRGGVLSRGRIVAQKGHHHPEIPSAPSLFLRLDTALDNLTNNVKGISSSLKDFLNHQNAQAIQNTLQNFSKISDDLERNSKKIDSILNNANLTLQNTANASKQLPEVMESVRQSAVSIKQMTKELTISATKADIMLSNGATAMQTVNSQLMPQLISSLTDVQAIITNVKSVSSQMAVDPSVIIRGREPAPTGPGE